MHPGTGLAQSVPKRRNSSQRPAVVTAVHRFESMPQRAVKTDEAPSVEAQVCYVEFARLHIYCPLHLK